MKPSKRFTFNKADWVVWSHQAITVLAPYLVVIIPVLISQIDKDWAYSAILVYLLQRVWSFLKLWVAGKPK